MLSVCAGFMALHAAADGPLLDADTFEVAQDETHVVTVAYTLNAPAIVTAAFCTNGVEVSGIGVRSVSGDINRILQSGNHEFRWYPQSDAPVGVSVTNGAVKLTAWPLNSPHLFMAVNLALPEGTDNLRFYPSEEALPYPVTDDRFKTDWLLMKRLYAAGREWRMGSPAVEAGRESPYKNNSVNTISEECHLVTLTNDYYMGVYEVTQWQIRLVTGQTKGTCRDLRCAANSVSPNDLRGNMAAGGAQDWPSKGHSVDSSSVIGRFRSITGDRVLFDLPTEAQWEFMARADSPYRYGIQDESDVASTNVAWNAKWPGNEGGQNGYAHIVGLLQPNAWGFYDTLGNVGEWCLDWREAKSSGDAEIEPCGPTTGSIRVARGGGYYWGAANTRCSSRQFGWAPDQRRDNHGFRLWAACEIK
ncbi:MAG: SUMF1/EgtB/PvdO family nonheme iron enzyme [Kiritimatiellae bacterium]|nr:SUMF1/EgtB/PvdO family nonheme iron enzyme [Kiritimatiellia bacterium]